MYNCRRPCRCGPDSKTAVNKSAIKEADLLENTVILGFTLCGVRKEFSSTATVRKIPE